MMTRLTIAEASKIAYDLLEKNGLYGWTVRISKSKTTLGSCNYGRKRITLSGWFIERIPREDTVNTILHEIAHALAPTAGHSRAWKIMARSIGAKPERLSRPRLEVPETIEEIRERGSYVGKCRCSVFYRHRAPKETIRYGCPKCGVEVLFWNLKSISDPVEFVKPNFGPRIYLPNGAVTAPSS